MKILVAKLRTDGNSRAITIPKEYLQHQNAGGDLLLYVPNEYERRKAEQPCL